LRTLNLGILAHVDAGKTTLTERLLYAAGVIDEIGSVDHGTTQTDSSALERRRGITIKSAVVSFAIDDVAVNLIDTPGHPDFIAEVQRVLGVLDGAVLVVSAVEGVQPQTRILMRALQRSGIATLVFVNKIDRRGARYQEVVRELTDKLTPAVISMGIAHDQGTSAAGFTPYSPFDRAFTDRLTARLATHDDALLATYLDDEVAAPYPRLLDELAAQTGQALVYPVFFGSAITGAGVEALRAGIARLLPAQEGDAHGPLSGLAFKVERGPVGERIAYVRLFSGTLRTRDRLPVGGDERKVTAIRVFERGSAVPRASVVAGQIAKLWGLGEIRIGDPIGRPPTTLDGHPFAPPTLQAVIVAHRDRDRAALHLALTQLAEQDPLINLRRDDRRRELIVSLYGEVQKEVIQETLARDFALDVEFRETTTICIERPSGTGAAVEIIYEAPNPILATVGLRVEPAAINSGVAFQVEVELGSIPLSFHRAVEETVYETLDQGLYGWQVTDCTVTMTHSGYAPRQSHAHQGFNRAMSSTGADFRNLTPLVLMAALQQAGTTVYGPMLRFSLEAPADTLGALLPVLGGLQAGLESPTLLGAACVLRGDLPAGRVHELQQRLPALTGGEGVLEFAFDSYRPVQGVAPTRPRTDNNPLNRKEYLLHVLRRV
jgi:ribosomal protection tetracycline resistance protein